MRRDETVSRDDEVTMTSGVKLITLPVHLNMTNEDIDYVIYWVKEFFNV